MNKKLIAVVAILVMALTASGERCRPPICAVAITPYHGQAPFVANIRYVVTQESNAEIYYGDGAIETISPKAGFVQHIYPVPGAYTVVVSAWNECGAFAAIVTVYVQ